MCAATSPTRAAAQTSSAKQAASKGAAQTPEGSDGLGFSIESEMLTYTALQRDAEAVGCDVLRFLNRTPAPSPDASTSLCGMLSGAEVTTGVVILTPNSKILPDFALWREDMAIMDLLLERAGDVGCRGTSGGSLLGSTLPGQGLSLATQGVSLVEGIFSANESTTAVRGTVETGAFKNAVARQLRSLGVPVLMPDTYMPFSLSSPDHLQYPFLVKIEKLEATRLCLLDKASGQGAASLLAGTVLRDSNAFLTSLLGWQTSVSPKPDQNKPSKQGSGTETQRQPETMVNPSGSHLASLLSVDLMVKEFGIGRSDRNRKGRWQHILWLQALESGGSVMKTGKFLGTKVRYGGGAVGTYAMFNLQGELECSGNVFDYGGPVRAQEVGKKSRGSELDHSNMVMLVGGCQPSRDVALTGK